MATKHSESKAKAEHRERLTIAAMQHAVEDRPQMGSNAHNYEHFATFTETFKKLYPDGTFDVTVVMDWSVSFGDLMHDSSDQETEAKETEDAEEPPAFQNNYALGKFMKKNQKRLGIEKAGSYGNRAFYRVLSEL